jgi:hypothetical protein
MAPAYTRIAAACDPCFLTATYNLSSSYEKKARPRAADRPDSAKFVIVVGIPLLGHRSQSPTADRAATSLPEPCPAR